jgi:hypothetical protein
MGESSSLTALHKNLAIEQWKKMCSVSSGSSQRAHLPLDIPFLLLMLSFEGRRFLISCHKKIRIFSGMEIRQISSKCFLGCP